MLPKTIRRRWSRASRKSSSSVRLGEVEFELLTKATFELDRAVSTPLHPWVRRVSAQAIELLEHIAGEEPRSLPPLNGHFTAC